MTFKEAQTQARKLQALARQQHNEEMQQLLLDLGIALGLMAVVSMGLGWFVAGRALSPLQMITRTARAISATSLHSRLALGGPRDELRELGDTFDALLDRLERSFEAQRQFVANASHELRTPVTVERAIIDVALDDPAATNEDLRAAFEELRVIGDQQERMIEALLMLARSERGSQRWVIFDLSEVVKELVAQRRAAFLENDLTLEVRLKSALMSGDPELIQRLAANLLDNAIRYNVSAGWVRLTTRLEAGEAILAIENSGPVVPSEEVERLFEPFTRLGAERSVNGEGHGLGLSIINAIATAHGAALGARARPDGGLEITVRFGGANGYAAQAATNDSRAHHDVRPAGEDRPSPDSEALARR